MTKPTYQDAAILLQLAQWHTASNLTAALDWLWRDRHVPDFVEPAEVRSPNSEKERATRLIGMYFETVGVLYKHGLVNDELLFDWLEVAPVWDRIKGYVLERRSQSQGDPLWANFEALAVAHKRHIREYST